MNRSLVPLIVAAVLVSAPACKSKPEPEKTPAQVASALVDDVSPLDVASAMPAAVAQEPWDPALCDLVPEREKAASFGELDVSGACSFKHQSPAKCNARGDDYYAIIERKLTDGSTVELYLNVEAYTGAGVYEKKGQILVLVRRGQSLYRWSNQESTVTLGFTEGGVSSEEKNVPKAQGATPTSVQIEPTVLPAEPGTATRGSIALRGTIGCTLKKRPR